ncbi:protein NEN1 [Selaginella moellendorffii]|nr:protein NEN1 [Selaginella moellendorffii]|eukprot:XP_002993628.2 protein NEN1 [Selaginella moellendorffii]
MAAVEEEGARAAMEIVFYDVETTVPEVKGQGYEILEFGAVVVSARGLEELDSFTTLVRPSSLALVSPRSVSCNGIVQDSLVGAPSFLEIADRVHALLHGRVWAGHNILRFDNLRIKEAFASIGRAGPEAAGHIDTFPLLRKSFGQRAGNLKMATLASYFGLGKQEHRSLADVRMNIEVLKLCATVLFLESNFPDIFPMESIVSPNQNSPFLVPERRQSARLSSLRGDAFNFNLLAVSLEEAIKHDDANGSKLESREETTMISATTTRTIEQATEQERVSEDLRNDKFLRSDEIFLDFLDATHNPDKWITLQHASQQLCIRETNARVKFSVSDRFAYSSDGKPTFSIVIVPTPKLLAIAKECEVLVKNVSTSMGIAAVWQPVLVANGTGDEALRIKIGTSGDGESASYTTKLFKKKQEDGSLERLDLPSVDPKTFQESVPAGCCVDVELRCDGYAFQGGKVGLRFLAEQLFILC